MGEPILSKALATCPMNADKTANLSVLCVGCGWLSWSLAAFSTALSGTSELLPKPEIDCRVMNLKSGHARANKSFLISRVLRDLESKYANRVSGLTIEILDASNPLQSVKAFPYTSAVCIIQMALLLVAFLRHDHGHVLLLFATAHALNFGISFMPAWTVQKFSARKDGGKEATYALIRGNGHRHVFIVRNKHKDAWNLEDLASMASARHDYVHSLELFILACAVIIFSGVAVLSAMLSDHEALYFLASLAMGTVGNILVGVLSQEPAMHGMPLNSIEVITHDSKVMATLQSLEEKYEGLGEPLLKEFLPAGITEEAQAWFDDLKDVRQRAREAGKQSEVTKVGQKTVSPLPANTPVESDEDAFVEMF
jgi:hypothetical protein